MIPVSYDIVDPESAGVDPARLDVFLRRARLEVEHGPLPSAQVAVAKDGKLVAFETFGDARPDSRDTADDTGDDSSNNPDAPPTSAAVEEVACAGGEMTITTPGFNFMPDSVTINAGEAVHFTLSSNHNVVSTTTGVTFGLGFGADACLKFNEARTYTFKCQPHSFTGSVVVQ